MNAYLNYLIEANAALCLLLLMYHVLLSRETNFRFSRLVLLTGILASLVFPMVHLHATMSIIPSLENYIPSYWLPEFKVGAHSKWFEAPVKDSTYQTVITQTYLSVYCVGMGLSLMLFLAQIFRLQRVLANGTRYRRGRYTITESSSDQPSFSFFKNIFIGRNDLINESEKCQIIKHEQVHGACYHSFDILLIRILKIFFWFNPVLSLYKKTFIQLHEFEADARAVENEDVNDYCSLLARVALQSADIKLANHFNQSLTVKRINMMRTIKTKIRTWKVAALAAFLPLLFFAIACQDQVTDDLKDIANNSSGAMVVPDNVQQRYDQLKKEHPTQNFILLQVNNEGMLKIKTLQDKYGLPKSMEVFKPEKSGDGEGFAILEYNEQVEQLTSVVAQKEGDVYTVVEQMPEYTGGFPALAQFLGSNIQYPTEARDKHIAGVVLTQFIVNADGSVSDFSILKGVSPLLDKEALRVVMNMPKWIPGKQNGKEVRVKFVLPIKFAES